MGKTVRYHCPFCNKMYTREDMVIHISEKHENEIPEEFTPLRITFHVVNRKDFSYHGICTECKGPTSWDENKGRYNRQCGKKSCHDSFIKKFEDNNLRKNGYVRLSSNPEGLERMLANRKISGTYTMQDGTKKTYTGSYEKKAVQFMDLTMNCKSEDIMMPGPIMEYQYNGESHWYIPDIYYIPYNLIIEVKDGGDKPNNLSMPDYRARQIAKEEHIIKNTYYNYLRLTNNDFSQLLAVMMDIKMQLVDHTENRVIHVNENMALASINCMVPSAPNSLCMVQYLKRNTFTDNEPELGVAGDIKLDTIFVRDKEGRLRRTDKKFLEKCDYNLYMVEDCRQNVSKAIEENLGKFVEEGFLYETVFHKKMYSWDQIQTESSAIPIPEFHHECDRISRRIYHSIMAGEGTIVPTLEGYQDLKTGDIFCSVVLESGETLLLEKDDPLYYLLKGND